MDVIVDGSRPWRELVSELLPQYQIVDNPKVGSVQLRWSPEQPIPASQSDLLDGMAKLIGGCDTIVPQPTGASYLDIGFATASRALSNVLTHYQLTGARRLVILGGGYLAASAIAAGVEHHYAELVVVADHSGGPGSAIAAAHNIGVTLTSVSPEKFTVNADDVVIDTMAGVWERVTQETQPRRRISTYVQENSAEFRVFATWYAREFLVLATGIETPVEKITTAVDNIFG